MITDSVSWFLLYTGLSQDAATGVGFRLFDGLTILLLLLLLLLHVLAVVATHTVAAAPMMLLLHGPLSTALLRNTMVKLILPPSKIIRCFSLFLKHMYLDAF
jgi:hypothetical protein